MSDFSTFEMGHIQLVIVAKATTTVKTPIRE
jgi:hypothetical protein